MLLFLSTFCLTQIIEQFTSNVVIWHFSGKSQQLQNVLVRLAAAAIGRFRRLRLCDLNSIDVKPSLLSTISAFDIKSWHFYCQRE